MQRKKTPRPRRRVTSKPTPDIVTPPQPADLPDVQELGPLFDASRSNAAVTERIRLYFEISDLWRIVKQNVASDAEGFPQHCRLHLEAMGQEHVPTMAELTMMKGLFYDQSDAEQRRQLNGWRPDPNRLRGADVLEDVRLAEPSRFLEISQLKPGVIDSYDVYLLDDSVFPVRVVCREGACRVDVLRGLERIIDAVRVGWDRMVARAGPMPIETSTTPISRRPAGPAAGRSRQRRGESR